MKVKDDVLEKLILDIENSSPQVIEKKVEKETFELRSDPVLTAELSGNIGALFVRAILNQLKIDEHHVFRWRLENKFRQYQILNHYVPNCMAETFGISQLLNEREGVRKIKELCSCGFFIKSTLGHRTGQRKNFDRTNELDDIINSYQEEYDGLENWILQKKLNFTEEFRVHSFNRDVIYGLTFIMAGKDECISPKVEEFVRRILEKLPATIVQGTLIGWDVGVTDTNEYYVIETNITGFHPEFHRGFQTSGYFGDPDYGSIMCAWLNNYFRIKHHISIAAVEESLLATDQFYQEFMFYRSIFKNEHVDVFKNKLKGIRISVIMYLGKDIDSLLIRLLGYFLEEDFAKMYYLIIDEKNISAISERFPGNNLIGLITEDKLISKDERLLIGGLSYKKRKEIYYQALGAANDESFFII